MFCFFVWNETVKKNCSLILTTLISVGFHIIITIKGIINNNENRQNWSFGLPIGWFVSCDWPLISLFLDSQIAFPCPHDMKHILCPYNLLWLINVRRGDRCHFKMNPSKEKFNLLFFLFTAKTPHTFQMIATLSFWHEKMWNRVPSCPVMNM